MSRLAKLQERIEMAGEAISRAERAFASNPDRLSAAATLRSFVLMRERLEQDFMREADALELGVFSYRIEYPDRARPTIAGLTSALSTFQRLFTTVYDAVVNGPKKRANPGIDVVDATAFGFSHTFAGSIGFMMTLATERLLLGQTKLDEAMEKTFELVKTRDELGFQHMTETVGLPAVRLVYQWAVENNKAGFGADLLWHPRRDEKSGVRVQPQEIRELAYVASSVMAKEQMQAVGELLHVNMFDRSFEMKISDRMIKGTFSNAISAQHPAQLPKLYSCTLTVSIRVALIEDVEQISYFLVKLEDPGKASGKAPLDAPSSL